MPVLYVSQSMELKPEPTGVNIAEIFPIPPLVFPTIIAPDSPKTSRGHKSIMQPTHLDLFDFVNLFRSFSICSRKDLKDLFEQFAATTPRLERKMPKELLNEPPPSRDSGECNAECTFND